ncbi:MAG: hypothetical protein JST85_09365 [Acidobacteria bacterium]|nr:hypothetical protein [Acidobacteriota bacterium]
MSTQLRKLRGVVGISLIWGILWAVIFGVLATIIGIVDPDSIDPGEEPAIIGLMGGVFGLVSGVVFGALLAVAENGREFRNFSLLRAALWGMLSSAVFPLLVGKYNQVFVMCPIGIVVALTLAAITRRAGRDESGRSSGLRDLLFACFLTPVRDVITSRKEAL